jgi:hypothetical protein
MRFERAGLLAPRSIYSPRLTAFFAQWLYWGFRRSLQRREPSGIYTRFPILLQPVAAGTLSSGGPQYIVVTGKITTG